MSSDQLPAPDIQQIRETLARHRHVLACHDELVAALERLLTSVERFGCPTVGDCNQARIALARAKGDPQ